MSSLKVYFQYRPATDVYFVHTANQLFITDYAHYFIYLHLEASAFPLEWPSPFSYGIRSAGKQDLTEISLW